MENTDTNEIMCSIHSDVIAKAVCLNTRELLCFHCAMEKVKSQGSNIVKDITIISDGVEKLLLDCLIVAQQFTKKINCIEKYEEKVESLIKGLNKKVQGLYGQLAENIMKMRDRTLMSIQGKHAMHLELCRKDKKKLKTLEMTQKKRCHDISDAKENMFDHYKTEIREAMNDLSQIADHNDEPDADFIVNNSIENFIRESEVLLLGEAVLFNHDYYQELNTTEKSADENRTDDVRINSGNKPEVPPKSSGNKPEVPPKPTIPKPTSISNTSDIIIYEKPSIFPRVKNTTVSGGIKIQTNDRTSVHNVSAANKTSKSENNSSLKEKKSRPWFFRRKDKRQGKLKDYEEVSLLKCSKAGDLNNKTLTLTEISEQFHTPFTFSKLVNVGPVRIGLLSKEHSTIFVSGLDGKVRFSRQYVKDTLISICEMTSDRIAVLTSNESKPAIEIIGLCDNKLEVKETIKVTFDMSEFTGLDYSCKRSYFAIGTKSQYFILDIMGNVLKIQPMNVVNVSSDVITIFDFEKNTIFSINKTEKKMKCLEFSSMDACWKKKFEDTSFKPESACLHKGKLCILSASLVTIFCAKNGELIRHHALKDLVVHCLGLCVIDGVFAISSNSKDFQESKTLGFVSL